jgi:hypothetical protein
MKLSLRHISFVLLILPSLALAEDTPKTPTDTPRFEGFDLLRDGAELLMQDLFAELEPALKGVEAFALELDSYAPPEMLPNGDIIIRRKTSENEGIGRPAVPVPPITRPFIEMDPMPDDDIEI